MNKKFTCTEEERQHLDQLYEAEPDLKKAGIEEFDGWYIHLDEVTDRCLQAWPKGKDPGCAETPLEYITAIIDERDDARKALDECVAQIEADGTKMGGSVHGRKLIALAEKSRAVLQRLGAK